VVRLENLKRRVGEDARLATCTDGGHVFCRECEWAKCVVSAGEGERSAEVALSTVKHNVGTGRWRHTERDLLGDRLEPHVRARGRACRAFFVCLGRGGCGL
jgi:hypothetical protein